MSKPSNETVSCNLRYAIKTTGRYGGESKRVTYLCKKRVGFMLKHWKCVGLNNKDCPLKK